VHISASPAHNGGGVDELFFRNIYSYLDDCGKQGVAPSLPQLLLFLDSAQVSLAFPGPPALMRGLSWALGLRACYGEYFDEGMVVEGVE